VVVAGDRRQPPPSAFFDAGTGDVDDYDEDELDPWADLKRPDWTYAESSVRLTS